MCVVTNILLTYITFLCVCQLQASQDQRLDLIFHGVTEILRVTTLQINPGIRAVKEHTVYEPGVDMWQ